MRLFILLLFLIGANLSAQNNQHAIYLIGDAGQDTKTGAALLMLKNELLKNPNSTVLFLGDNVYPEGLVLSDTNTVLRLKSQLDILKEYKGNIFFIPGNHDWAAQKRAGWQRLNMQQQFVEAFIKDSTTALNRNTYSFLPQGALPGPHSVVVSKGIRIIFIDTQWFLHFHKKNKTESIKKTKNQFYKSLDSLLNYSKQNNERVIIAAHHPIYTNGSHSMKKQPLRFIINYTPFKLFGWLGMDRLLSQDIDAASYKKMRKNLLAIINKYDNISYVSGHDHNMQYFLVNRNSFIVSGCGSKLSAFSKKKRFESVFQADDKIGFIKMIFQEPGNRVIEVYKEGEMPFEISK